MGRKSHTSNGPHIFWRNGRAYADFRAYADVGGGRGALAESGSTWGTTEPAIAEALFAAQLAELQAKRAGRVGIEQRRTTTLAELACDHLLMKAQAGRTSHSHLADLEQRLRAALDHFGRERGPRSVEPAPRRSRHTYCSARLQTVQRIVKPGKDPAHDPEPYEWIEVSRFTVQKEMGHGGAQLVDRIYGHAQRNPHRSEVVEYRVEKHAEQLGHRLAALAAGGMKVDQSARQPPGAPSCAAPPCLRKGPRLLK